MKELEHEYLERILKSSMAQITQRLKNGNTQSEEQLTKALAYWNEALKCYEADLSHECADRLKKMYRRDLTKAVRDGRRVSKTVEQSEAYRTVVENRRRYEKGRHTSFANRSAAVDDSMKSKRGYKAKRQDGNPMTPVHLGEIDAIVTDFESVVGSMADLFAKTDLTIAHTNGKHPFMRSAGGIYHAKERTISVGVVVSGTPILAGAHELTHWLDAEAGAAMGASTTLSSTSGRQRYDSTYMSQFVGRDASDPEFELLANASHSINRRPEARQMFSTKTQRTVERDRLRASLGPYWYRRCEIYARLVEQWIATKLGKRCSAADSPEVYQSLPGWWAETDFLQFMSSVEKSVMRRIELLQ